jgi:deazaflavin-dependent oxidoreductase (nitroreductase family)
MTPSPNNDDRAAADSQPESSDPGAANHYRKPDVMTHRVFNPMLNGLMRLGISIRGSRVLEHRGRRTGAVHHTPVNLLMIDGQEYLVAPRGETQWVRNVRADGGRITLLLGRRRQTFQGDELPAEQRTPILRAYLRKWKFEVGMFFDGVSPDSTDEEFAAIADNHPVFALH